MVECLSSDARVSELGQHHFDQTFDCAENTRCGDNHIPPAIRKVGSERKSELWESMLLGPTCRSSSVVVEWPVALGGSQSASDPFGPTWYGNRG
jgi:hypothetical protein